MDPAEAWATGQLAGFLALVSSLETETSAAACAVEQVADALDAEVAAIVAGRTVMAAIGYPEGATPRDELAAVASGAARELVVPGAGPCPATVVALEHPPGAALVLARSKSHGLSREETSVLRGMAQVMSLTMRMLHLVDDQSALRRVATLVARGTRELEVFTAVAEEVGRLAGADLVQMLRYEPDRVAVRIAVWGATRGIVAVGGRVPLGGHNVLTLVHETGQQVRVDDVARMTGAAARITQALGVRSVIGSPIVVSGRTWGLVLVTTSEPEPMPADVDRRIAGFTELVATAIANAEARLELAASRARVVAAADETRRRFERDLHDGIQQRLVTLALELRGAIDETTDQSPALQAQLAKAQRALEELLEEVREISRGLHPAILSEAGLVAAVRSLARRSAVPVELHLRLAGRFPPPIEVAAYYVISEALANTAKYAGASLARVLVETVDGSLRIQVSDDGIGGADPTRGSGLFGLTDRVEAVGGTIVVSSPAGSGTTIAAELPTGRD